jgi:hypothetical protein
MPSTATSMLDGLSTSVAVKAPCAGVEAYNITLSGLQGYTADDRVLVIGQTDASENGIYSASTGSWTRTLDADGNRDLVRGTLVIVRSDVIEGAIYELTSESPSIDTSDITFELWADANVTYPQTQDEIDAGVTPTNTSFDVPNAKRYGFAENATGAVNRAAVVSCLAANGRAFLPKGSYAWAGLPLTLAGGQHVYGEVGDKSKGSLTILYRAATDWQGFFKTDSTVSSFSGLRIDCLRLKPAYSATWADVSAVYAIESHYPFTNIRCVDIEQDSGVGYRGNGVRIHDDNHNSNGGSMGGWMSNVDVRFIGTDNSTTPGTNDQIAVDLDISGGHVHVTGSLQRCDIGVWARRGENITIDADLENIRGGAAATRTRAALMVGEPNSRNRVKGLYFAGYVEAVGRLALLQNCEGVTLSPRYANALRAYSPSGSTDGFIYNTKTSKGMRLVGSSIEMQYNLPALVYSETNWASEGNRYFLNVTDSSGVPQPYFGPGFFDGVLPSGRHGDVCNRITSASSSGTITGASASGSLVNILDNTHGLSTDDYVWITGITGTVGDEVNDQLWQITRVDANNFTLNGSEFAGSYTSGGTWYLATTEEVANTAQLLTGAGAVSLRTLHTTLVTTGANALTLADGYEGQEKYLVMRTDGGDGTLTPTNLYNGTTITFNDVGDSAFLKFMDSQWVFMGGTATLA